MDPSRVIPTVCSNCNPKVEGKPVKNLHQCDHVFCNECIESYLKERAHCLVCGSVPKAKVGEENNNGPKESEDERADGGSRNESEGGQEQSPVESRLESPAECGLCQFSNTSALRRKAENFCEDCRNLYLCQECTRLHGENKITRKHVVVPVSIQGAEERCQEHGAVFKDFCCTCSKAVCNICVLLIHGDHEVESMFEVSRERFSKLSTSITANASSLKEVKGLQDELSVMRSIVVNKRDTVLKAIDAQTEKCMDLLLQNKAELVEKVLGGFRLAEDITKTLDNVPEIVNVTETAIAKSEEKTCGEYKVNFSEIENLGLLIGELKSSSDLQEGVEGTCHWKAFQKIYQNPPTFVPHHTDMTVGIVEPRYTEFAPNLLFEHTVKHKKNSSTISSLANLGNGFFVVAHTYDVGKPGSYIEIYEFPGTPKHTLDDDVYPVHDMAATPDGKLAVLSDGTDRDTQCVRIVDPETGNVKSSKNFSVSSPRSMSVNLRHQYVILGDGVSGMKQITVIDEDGTLDFRREFDPKVHGLINPCRISCGGRFVFVMGRTSVVVFVLGNSTLTFSSLVSRSVRKCNIATYMDISATFGGELYSIQFDEHDKYMFLNRTKGLFQDAKYVHFVKNEQYCRPTEGDNMEWRVSVRDDYLVLSQGCAFRVYQI